MLLAMALAGCGAMQNLQDDQAMDTEKLLAQARFRVLVADTPQKLAHLRTLPQQQLTSVRRAGRVYYIFADSSACQCLYIGGEEAYQRYRGLAAEQQLAQQQQIMADVAESMNWDMWGPWESAPWY